MNYQPVQSTNIGIFFDIPNILHHKHYHISDINWAALVREILKSFGKDDVVWWAGAYMPVGDDGHTLRHLRGLVKKYFGKGVDTYLRQDGDVDAWIITDMLGLPLRVLNEAVRGEEERVTISLPVPLRIVLVSGDGGFARVTSVFEKVRDVVACQVDVWAWEMALSQKLIGAARSVSHLNDIPDLLHAGCVPFQRGGERV